VWPARVTVAAGGGTSLHIANHTRRRVWVMVQPVGLALDLRGAPRAVRSSAGSRLLAVRRRRVVIAAGGVGSVVVRGRAARGLGPGDRPALVLLTAQTGGGAGIGVQVRIGVPVEVRVPGAVHRRLVLGALHVRGRRLELLVRNRGNVDERVDRGAVVVEVWRASRRVAVLPARARDLLPHSRGLVEFRLPKGLRGRRRIVVRVSSPRIESRSFLVAF
jgi:hypothetical protein